MAHHLSVDIETYSSVDIKKGGLYKYVQAPDFQILLFAYSLDGGPVEVVDLTECSSLPPWLPAALFDPGCIKHAYNAAFEWYCLSKYLGRPLPLDQWQCTMLHGLYCGYPAGLGAVGKALGLPEDRQKLSTGRALIKYFCVPCAPTKTNGGRTRNLPHHDPARWDLFKEYNRQDVVTEMEIERRLSNFPVPAEVQRQWVTDQRVNARGVAVDMELVDGALWCGNTVREELTKEAVALSGLQNPNSVAQLSAWLEKETGEEVTDLRKDTVAEMLETNLGSAKVRRMLEIRQELGKTSTKKYNAMEATICGDGRTRGLLQFYGANRTGRWCLTGDHEVLTPNGWVSLNTWKGGEIACWSPQTEFISFQTAGALCFPYTGKMVQFNTQRCEQISTPDHKMAVMDKNGNWVSCLVQEIAGRRVTIPFTGRRLNSGSLNPECLRTLIMTQADGHYTRDGDLRFHFKKARKIERCKHLLRRCEIPFTVQPRPGGATVVTIKSRCLPLWLRQFKDKTFGYWLLDESPDILFDELPLWDGYQCGPNSIQYTTTNRQNADVLQAAAVLSGRSATLLKKERTNSAWSDAYILNIWNTPGRGTSIRKEQSHEIDYDGLVYCAETATGYFLVRRNGKVWVTGNSGRLVQVQNLPRTHLDMLPWARKCVKAQNADGLRAIYGSIPDTLSQLIRTALVASPGNLLVDADFSAIEARVIAWLAGEQWVLEVFRTHGKIYEAQASQMFGVPIDRIVKGNPEYELRQKGKVATLALGYQGGVGSLVSMGALRMGLTEEELPDIVRRWRGSNRRICDLWYGLENAAHKVLQTGRPAVVRGLTLARECDPENGLDFLTIQLPSGRKLYYAQPHFGANQWGGESIKYMGMDQVSKKWTELDTYGGKLAENCIQAIARDCLAEAIERLEAAGYAVVFHVHDEVVIDCPQDRADLDAITEIMAQPPVWAPDLPMAADGWVDEFYKKD